MRGRQYSSDGTLPERDLHEQSDMFAMRLYGKRVPGCRPSGYPFEALSRHSRDHKKACARARGLAKTVV